MPGAGQQLREAVARERLVVAPGAYDAISARVIERAGFPAVYLGAGCFSNVAYGRPDVGWITMQEVTTAARALVEAIHVPLVVDADTGYGGLVNVRRTVEEFERAGVAGIHLEDQKYPKRCGYFPGGQLVSIEEMRQRLAVAIDARRDADFVIIARTDAAHGGEFSEAVARARAYAATGADMVFVNGMKTVEQVRRVVDEVPAMHVYNVSGSDQAPVLHEDEIRELGYRLCIYPLQAARLAIRAVQRMMSDLKIRGTIKPWLGEMITFQEWEELGGVEDALSFDRKFSR